MKFIVRGKHSPHPKNFSGIFINRPTVSTIDYRLSTRTYTRHRPNIANRDIQCAGCSAEHPAVLFEALRGKE